MPAIYTTARQGEIENDRNGKINLELFQKLRDGADIFTTVSAATFI